MNNMFNKYIRIYYFIFVFVIIIVSINLSANLNSGVVDLAAPDPGGTAAKFLTFTPSARAAAMGEAFVAVEDANSIALNPAALAFLRHPELSVTHSQLFQENALEFLAGVLPIKGKYAIGVELLVFSTPKEEIYDWTGNPTGKKITYSGAAFGLAGAVKLTENVSIGINVKNISEQIMDDRQDTATVDLGAFIKIPLTNGIIQLGAAVSPGARMRENEDTIGFIRAGAAFVNNELTVSGEFSKGLNSDEDMTELNIGGEYWIGDIFAPRVGYKINENVDETVTFGFGLRLNNFYFDYAAIPNATLGISHKVGLGVKLGMLPGEKVEKPKKVKKERPTPFKKVEKRTPIVAVKPEERLNIAVAELDGKNVSSMDAAIVSDFIRTEFVKTRTFNVLDRQNMEKILEEQSFQLSGCTTEECAVQMGKILNVQYIAVGSFSKFLETYYINVSFIDVETGRIVGAESAECASGRELPAAAKQIAESFAVQFGQ